MPYAHYTSRGIDQEAKCGPQKSKKNSLEEEAEEDRLAFGEFLSHGRERVLSCLTEYANLRCFLGMPPAGAFLKFKMPYPNSSFLAAVQRLLLLLALSGRKI